MNRKQLYLVIGSFVVVAILIVASTLLRDPNDEGDRTKVVATFYPLAYMAESIGGDRVSVSSLVPYNTELHSWQPAPQDIIRADRADVILYNGGPADRWLVDDMLPAINNAGKVIVNTTIGVSYIAGGHDHDEEEHEEEEHEGGTDPHTWLSPKRAMAQARNVYDALCEADPEGEEYFTERFNALNATLASLDEQYRSLGNTTVSGIVVSHSAYGYIAYDYGFEQMGIIGLSGDQEADAHVYDELATYMMNNNISVIFIDPTHFLPYADTLESAAEELCGYDVIQLDLPLLLGPYDDMDYLDMLSQNLVNLRIGLQIV